MLLKHVSGGILGTFYFHYSENSKKYLVLRKFSGNRIDYKALIVIIYYINGSVKNMLQNR